MRLWTELGICLLISISEKLNLFRLTSQITLVLLMRKWIGMFLKENHLVRCWTCLSLLNRVEAPALSLLLKPPPKKMIPDSFYEVFFS